MTGNRNDLGSYPNQFGYSQTGGNGEASSYGASGKAASTGDYSFRKSYGFSHADDTSGEKVGSSGPGFVQSNQTYGQLHTPAPTISANPPRPDWLDDSEHTTGATGDPEKQERSFQPKTQAGDTGFSNSDWTHTDRDGESQRAAAREPNPAPTPRDTQAAAKSSAGSQPVAPMREPKVDAPVQAEDWTPLDAKHRHNEAPATPPVTSPMQLEWYVKEDGTDSWSEESWPAELPSAELPSDELPSEAHEPVGPAAKARLIRNEPQQGVVQANLAQSTAIELDLYADRRYRSALERMQFAQWSETLVLLRAVQRDHPNHANLAALINEAELKAAVVDQWADKVRGRRLTVRQELILRRAVPILLLLILFVGAAGFYRAFVEPSRQAVAMTQSTLRTLDEAQQLAFAGRFAEALALYDQVLASDPGNPLARQGRREAEGLYAVATEYEMAMRVVNAGNLTRAAGMLGNLLSKAPGFRDAEGQLARVEMQLTAREQFAAAEANFRLERWLGAVQGYEAVLAINVDFESDTVRQRLQESYAQAGKAIVTQWPTDSSTPALAQEYFRKAATARRSDSTIQTELNRLDRYFRGEQALDRADLREAINIWRSLYDEESGYLGGYLADQLYRAYLNLANRALQQNDNIYAMDLYQLAAELDVKDNSEAVRGLEKLRAQAVAPTPTPEPTARPPQAVAAYQPPAYQPPVAPPPPQPTPIPTATPEPDFGGWIAFRSNRTGSESIFVMRPDGSEQQPAPESIRSRFSQWAEAERVSPDGNRILSVRMLEGRENPSIFVTDTGMPEGAARDFQLTNYNRDEYDPVWSPTGKQIAFVSNHLGNDEVFVMNADGTNHLRLTWNEWEWDKHPSFSPDGSQIAFYTNRSGPRQIFLMNADGGGQWNISRNPHDDWDPIWIKR